MVVYTVTQPSSGVFKTDHAEARTRLSSALPKLKDDQDELPPLSRSQFLRFRQQLGLYIKARKLRLQVAIPETERSHWVTLNSFCKDLG